MNHGLTHFLLESIGAAVERETDREREKEKKREIDRQREKERKRATESDRECVCVRE